MEAEDLPGEEDVTVNLEQTEDRGSKDLLDLPVLLVFPDRQDCKEIKVHLASAFPVFPGNKDLPGSKDLPGMTGLLVKEENRGSKDLLDLPVNKDREDLRGGEENKDLRVKWGLQMASRWCAEWMYRW